MDLNLLLARHQKAVHRLSDQITPEERRSAGLCERFHAEEVRLARASLGRFGRFTWTTEGDGILAHG